ncbi:MAG: ATP-binding protein [Desulfovibrio sp.]|nr:ATP-binding protein [Desulfovibrio sp.]
MRIAFASGKGGAGKTTVAASLGVVWPRPCLMVDADVEAPNLHLFLHPRLDAQQPVYLTVPELDEEKCTVCGDCAAICSYKAIARLGAGLTIFADMCHGCGGCFEVCQPKALKKGRRELGSLQWGTWSLGQALAPDSDQPLSPDPDKTLLMGKSRIGEAMSPPLLRALEGAISAQCGNNANTVRDILIDSPPGVSCPAMTTARMADALVLVAEPTPFGMYDFKLAHAAFRKLNMPLAVVMNRAGIPGNETGDAALESYCTAEGLPLLASLPFDQQAAEAYARGHLPLVAQSANALIWQGRFEYLYEALRQWAGGEIRPHDMAYAGAGSAHMRAGHKGGGHA